MPTSTAIAGAVRILLSGKFAQHLSAAKSCLQSFRSPDAGPPPDREMYIFGLLLKIYATAVDIYRACEGLQPQIGSLPGHSLGDTEILNDKEQRPDKGSYFDVLEGDQPDRVSDSLKQLLEASIRIGEFTC